MHRVQRNLFYRVPILEMQTFSLLNFGRKRPNNSLHSMETELVEFLRQESLKGHFPSRRELENTFHLHFGKSFGGIRGLYEKAGVGYRPQRNQATKYEKATLFTAIVLELLPKLGLVASKVRGVHEQGVDILALNKEQKRVGVELKAYTWFEMVKQRNIEQLKRFIAAENLDRCFLLTTTDRIMKSISLQPNITIVSYNALVKLADEKQVEKLNSIRSKSVNEESLWKEQKRQEIIRYAKQLVVQGERPSMQRLNNDLHIELPSYFKNIREFYRQAGISLPSDLWGGHRGRRELDSTVLNQFLAYIQEEVQKGRYPGGVDIGKKFGVSHIWNFVRVSELYEMLGIPPYRKRKMRLSVGQQLLK